MSSPHKPAIDRQAVIVIHGIGEQRPMDTLRGFVETIAPKQANSAKPNYYSKPDDSTDSFEMRRLTAHEHAGTHKTDYFELYWAQLMPDTRLSDVRWWIQYLFGRWPGGIPARLRWVYYTVWTLVAVAAGLATWLLPKVLVATQSASWLNVALPLAASALSGVVLKFVLEYLGDAVRYFNARPRNIHQRQQIRQAGIDLLTRLHDAQENGQNKYDRIMVVGHSLGSVIAYDIVNLFWYDRHKVIPPLSDATIEEAEQAARTVQADKNASAYQQTQFDTWQSQYKQAGSWRISDLITVGSPLAFADLYLAKNAQELTQKQAQREFSTCPPTPEPENGTDRFSYAPVKGTPGRIFHHAAVFALTSWTNISFTNDFVGGPVTCFGPGVVNKVLVSKRNNWFPFVSHGYYWRAEETDSITMLQKALKLRLFHQPTPSTTPRPQP